MLESVKTRENCPYCHSILYTWQSQTLQLLQPPPTTLGMGWWDKYQSWNADPTRGQRIRNTGWYKRKSKQLRRETGKKDQELEPPSPPPGEQLPGRIRFKPCMNTTKDSPSSDSGLTFQTHALQMILFGPFYVRTQHCYGLSQIASLQLL